MSAPAKPGHSVRVFLSHSSTDLRVAKWIAAEVRAAGAETFLDGVDIAHGNDFEEAILQAEKACSESLVLLTPWALHRQWVWLEIGFFRHSSKRIVGLLHGVTVDKIASDPSVTTMLKRLDMLDLNNIDSYLAQLRKRVTG